MGICFMDLKKAHDMVNGEEALLVKGMANYYVIFKVCMYIV